MDRDQRFREFLRRLQALPAAASRTEARNLIEQILNEVENELSGIPYNPKAWREDGRLYPPQDDRRWEVPDHPRVWAFRSKGHNTFLGANGAIEIRSITTEHGELADPAQAGRLEFEKPGADEKGVWD